MYQAKTCPVCGAMNVCEEFLKCNCGFMEVKQYITIEQYFGNEPYNDELHRNADALLLKVNSLLSDLGAQNVVMTSGFRSKQHNFEVGGAPNSLHCQAMAIDLSDNQRVLGNRLVMEPHYLVSRGLYCENLAYCETARGTKWLHIQNKAPKSGNRFFIPYSGDPIRK